MAYDIPFVMPRRLRGWGSLVMTGWILILVGALAAIVSLASRTIGILVAGLAAIALGTLLLRIGMARGFGAYAPWRREREE